MSHTPGRILVCLFIFNVKWHINLCTSFNAKAILVEEQLWYYLNDSWEDKEFHTLPKGICPKVNVIARLEFVLNYTSAVHRFNYYTRSPHHHPRFWLVFISFVRMVKFQLFTRFLVDHLPLPVMSIIILSLH